MVQKNSPKILILLSGFSNSGVGEQFLESMLQGYDLDSIVRYSTVVSSVPDTSIHGYKSICKQVPYSLYPVLSHQALRRFSTHYLSDSIADIQQIVKAEEIDLIWVFMNSWYTIQLAGALVDQVSIPMVTHVWDAPEYISRKGWYTKSMKQSLVTAFAKAMSAASAGVTVSDGMTTKYKDRYGLDTRPMVFCPPKSIWKQPVWEEKDTIHIVFAGSLYAYKQWNALLDALEYSNRQTDRKQITVTCLGQTSRWARKRKWVRYETTKPMNEAADIVSTADIAYLPYWMSRRYAYIVKMAFPGKMSFYTAAATPVLFHGPVDSSPSHFLKKYKVGMACHSHEATDILQTIDEIISTSFKNTYIDSRASALAEVFDPQLCQQIFLDTVNSALAPEETQ